LGFRVWGFVSGLGLGVWGFGVYGLRFWFWVRVQGLGFRIEDSEFPLSCSLPTEAAQLPFAASPLSLPSSLLQGLGAELRVSGCGVWDFGFRV
jgi:hypothetical protein